MKRKLNSPNKDKVKEEKKLKIIKKNESPPPQQPIAIQNKTFTEYRQELKFIQQKIKNLQTKRYCSKQQEWGNLNQDIKQILFRLNLKNLKKIFERKFQQQIRLLNDFYERKYHHSMFQFCFFCCPTFILRQLKYYNFIDEIFEITIGDVQKTERNIYFYLNLLYIKLFSMMVNVEDRLQEEFNKKMIKAMAIQSKQAKTIEKRKKEVGELEQIQDVFVMQEQNFKNLEGENQIVSSYIIQSDNPAKIKGKLQPRQPFDVSLMKQNHYDEFKAVQKEIQTIISNDWKDIINCEEWSSQSYYGFIQVNSDTPIYTFLEFKDCKLKTNHMFPEISSSSFDLRTYLVKKHKHSLHKYQYVLHPLNSDSVHFQLTFWLSESQRTDRNHQNIEKFLLLVMRIGIKQKIYRTCNIHYKEATKKWMIRNYVHMSYKEHDHTEIKTQNEKSESQTSYQSLSQVSSEINPQMFWWVNLGEALIKAIVEVANEKRKEQKQIFKGMKKVSKKKISISSQYDYNPQTIQRLAKPPNLNKKNYRSANQI